MILCCRSGYRQRRIVNSFRTVYKLALLCHRQTLLAVYQNDPTEIARRISSIHLFLNINNINIIYNNINVKNGILNVSDAQKM